MFHFTTTTVINANEDYLTGLELFAGQDATADKPASLDIKRHLKFLQPNVQHIYKSEYVAPKLAKASLDLSYLGKNKGDFRIAMYIQLSQSNANSYYSNDLVFKGKPFYIEFQWKNGEAATEVAKKIKEIVKKYMLLVYEKQLIKVSVEGTKVILTGTDEYQRFVKVDIEEYVKGDAPMFGHYEVVKSAMTDDKQNDPDYDSNFVIEQGVEGFGTYQWILKNLRLPSAARTSWISINKDEAPIIGEKYNEYVINYLTNRGIMGSDAVGEVTKSLTTHVFFVRQAIASDFEAALEKVKPAEGIIECPSK